MTGRAHHQDYNGQQEFPQGELEGRSPLDESVEEMYEEVSAELEYDQ